MSFTSFLSKKKALGKFTSALDAALDACEGDDGIDVYTVASLAGGTGSGLFMPIALYVKKYFEEKCAKIAKSIAILAMPDIYENCYSAEQRVKSYANAYAALREYNAVLLSTHAEENVNSASGQPPIMFKLGNQNGVPEVLFDSEKSEYRQPSANPFDRLYLFERVPGVMSAGMHADIIADIIVSICKCDIIACSEKTTKKATDAIFGGISLVNINYPQDSIVKYITKRQLSDLATCEIVRAHKAVLSEMRRRSGEARLYGYAFSDNIEQYAEIFVAVADDMFSNEGTNLALIGRDPMKFENDRSADNVGKINYLSELSAVVDESLECESRQLLEALISSPIRVTPGKRRKAKTKPIDVVESAADCRVWLRDVYRHGLKAAVNEKQKFVSSLLEECSDSSKFSIPGNILTKDGEYLHPVYALLRLCLVHRELSRICKRTNGYRVSDEPDFDKAELSDKMLRVDRSTLRSKYAKQGENRFGLLINDQAANPKKLADDSILFIRDLDEVYHRLTDRLRGFQYATALEVVESMISAYRSFFDCVCSMSDDLDVDVKLMLISGGSDNGNVVNVGAASDRKQALYAEYIKSYIEDSDAVFAYTALMGKLVRHAIMQTDEDSSYRGAVSCVFDGLEKLYSEQCRASALYRNEIERNVLDVMLDTRNAVSLSKVFRGRIVPLHVKMPEAYSEYKTVKSQTVSIFDREIHKFIENNPDRLPCKDPVNFVEKLMYRAGEYEGVATFADNIGQKKMLLRRETVNIRPYFVEMIDELSDEHLGYKCYIRALRNMVAHTTKMWDPHIVYSRCESAGLPFINPNMQMKYETDVAKAVTYAMHIEELFTSDFEGKGEVFFVRKGVEAMPVFVEDQAVTSSDIDSLMLWAYRHPAWVSVNAGKFDGVVNEELRHVPSNGVAGSNSFAVKRALGSSTAIAMIKNIIVCLAAELFTKSSGTSGRFANCLAKLGHSIVLEFCKKGFEESEELGEHFITLYGHQLDAVMSALVSNKGRSMAEITIKQFNLRGYFRPYNMAGELQDYCLDSYYAMMENSEGSSD